MPEELKLPVKMIANRDYIVDNIYKTGRWERGEIKLVPPKMAGQMIRHADTYSPASGIEAAEQKAAEVKEVVKRTDEKMGDEATQELRDKVGQMTKEMAIDYAAVHYGLKIPGTVSEATARARLTQHIDLVGPA